MADETQVEQTPAEPTREDLIAAAEAALGAQPAEKAETTATAPAGEQASTEGEKPADEPRWMRIVREREKGHAERVAADNYAAEQRKAAEAERERIIAEAREQARRTAEEELAAARAKFTADPIAHLRALGTPEEIQDAVLRSGTPEARAMQKLQEELAATKAQASESKKVREEFEAFKKSQEQAAWAKQLDDTKRTFLGNHATEEKAPYLNARYDAEELFQKANQVAIGWRNAGMQLHKDFDFDDVVQYMESEAKKRFDALNAKSQPQVNGAAPVSGIAPKVPANGPRTISASTNGERRSAPKPLADMTPAQQRQALIEEAEAAMKEFEAKR